MTEQTNDSYDLVVIGAGPGGYVAAIRGAQLGMRTACIEKTASLGGTCLNVGCIPSKALLESSEHFEVAQQHLKDHGVEVSEVSVNLPTMLARKDKIVTETTRGVASLFKKNNITHIQGTASIPAAGKIAVHTEESSTPRLLDAKNILVASGSEPTPLPFAPFDGEKIISSSEALCLQSIPKHLVIIGAGVIGLELGSVWRRLGAKVSIVEMMPSLFVGVDDELSKQAERIFKRQGIKFHFETQVKAIQTNSSGVSVVTVDKAGAEQVFDGDLALVAIGRRPHTATLGLEALGAMLDPQGRIVVNEHYQTNIPNLYAVGDAINGPMLAHKASEEGTVAVERMASVAGHVNYRAIPWVVYTWPEIAWVGEGETALKAKGIAYRSGTYPFMANPRARTLGEKDGWVKVLADATTDELLGVTIIGPRASDMIAEAAIAMEFHASAEDLARSVHAHPTLSEAIKEAALGVDKRSIHL